LTVLTVLLTYAPGASYPLVESSIVAPVYQLACSPLIAGQALEALASFFGALVEADNQIASHVVPGLVIALEKSNAGETSPANVSKCISAIVKGAMSIAAGVIAEFAKAIRVRRAFL